MSEQAEQLLIPGSAILDEVLTAYRPFHPILTAAATTVTIVRVETEDTAPAGWAARARASEISARRKTAMFATLGAAPEELVLPPRVSRSRFIDVLERANADPAVAAIIVQLPVQSRLADDLDRIDPGKDIDDLGSRGGWGCCATADGIARIVYPFLKPGITVAVVGSRGFVGAGVARLLTGRVDRPIVGIDAGDELGQVRDVDIVISTTGQPGLLTGEHLHRGHQLVIDGGFVPSGDTTLSDVHPLARALPRAITPVPGGIGPIEMAVLAERLVQQHLTLPTPARWESLITSQGLGTPLTTAGRAVSTTEETHPAIRAANLLGPPPQPQVARGPLEGEHTPGPMRGLKGPQQRPGRRR